VTYEPSVQRNSSAHSSHPQNSSSKSLDMVEVFWYYLYAPDEATKKPPKSANRTRSRGVVA
ncbi:MAG TPA: hypothetical protein VFV38_39110, partial [Ktedonobacteraceae bacterium]|nr:hypothetical protein [Ktedonobacteraceae bacterium]